jgi:hypothetical protein
MFIFGFYKRLFQNGLLNFETIFELAGIDFWSKLKQNAACWPSSGWQRSILLSMRKPGQREAPMFMRESPMKTVELWLLCADITIWKETSPRLKEILADDRTTNRSGNLKNRIFLREPPFRKPPLISKWYSYICIKYWSQLMRNILTVQTPLLPWYLLFVQNMWSVHDTLIKGKAIPVTGREGP